MIPAVPGGGVGLGVQRLARADAPAKAGQVAARVGAESFQAQLQSMQGFAGGAERTAGEARTAGELRAAGSANAAGGSRAAGADAALSRPAASVGVEAIKEPADRKAELPNAGAGSAGSAGRESDVARAAGSASAVGGSRAGGADAALSKPVTASVGVEAIKEPADSKAELPNAGAGRAGGAGGESDVARAAGSASAAGGSRAAGADAALSMPVAASVELGAVKEPADRKAELLKAADSAGRAKAGVVVRDVPPITVAGADGRPRVAAALLHEPKAAASGLPVEPLPVEGALSGATVARNLAPKKATGGGQGAAPLDSADTKQGSHGLAEGGVEPVAVLPMPMPVAPAELTKVVAGNVASHAVGTAAAVVGEAKAPAGRHEGKKPVSAGHEIAKVARDGSEVRAGASGSIAVPETPGGNGMRPLVAVATEGAGGASAGAGSLASAPIAAVPAVALAPALAGAGGSAHQAVSAPTGGSHEQMEVAGGVGLDETKTLVSTPNVLEVGITGGAHGWLRVRAELGHTGEVTASLVASSTASADALHKELGSMSAYLKNEAVGVSSLAVSAMEKGAATEGQNGSSATASAGARGGPGAEGGSRPGPESGDGSKRSLFAGFGGAASESAATGYGSQAVPTALLGAGIGGWLNVRV